MKRILFIITGFLFLASANAQLKIEKHLPSSGKESISLNIQISDSINVQTWDKNEVYVNGSVNINDNKDNDAYETSFNESGKTIIVNAGFKEDYFKGKKNCCNESEIYWQVFIPVNTSLSIESINADITITGETGPLNIKSISGFIDLAFSDRKSADLDFSTISGTIYSDHILAAGGDRKGGFPHIDNRLNNGGGLIKLETISGDIFFRRSKQ